MVTEYICLCNLLPVLTSSGKFRQELSSKKGNLPRENKLYIKNKSTCATNTVLKPFEFLWPMFCYWI